MAKDVKKPEEAKSDEQANLNALVQAGQRGETGGSPSPPPPPPQDPPKAEAGKKTGPVPLEEQIRRVGDACPRRGCKGHLVLMSTFKTARQTIRQLNCTSCKLVGGREVSDR